MTASNHRDRATGAAAAVSRRRLLTAAGGAPLAASALAGPAAARARRDWRLVTSWPKGSPGPGTTARRLAERITAMSEGELTVRLYGAGELAPAFGVFDAVGAGAAEMGHTASFFWTGKAAASVFFTAVPFGLTPEAHNAWLQFGGGQELWDELYAPFGLKPLPAGNSGVQFGGWYRRELRGLDDLAGLKVRMPGLTGEILRRLGAVAVTLPPGDIFGALMSGMVDGAEYLGPWGDRGLGLHQAAPYYYWPGFQEPNGSAECLINRSAFDALPDHLRAIVVAACEAENARGLAEADWMNAEALAALEAEGVALRRFPDDILEAAYRTSIDVLDELGAGDPLAGRILQSYRQAQRRALAWARVGRHAVLDAALRLREAEAG